MLIELINTGSELLNGRTLNTHVQWFGQKLAEIGMALDRQTSIPDRADTIRTAVSEALGRADLVVVTGGLGPTSDDRTRDEIARLLAVKLVQDDAVLAHIHLFFQSRNRPAPRGVDVQAMIPDGARVIPNAHGTAPGIRMEVNPNPFRPLPSTLWMLPGPPRELRPMVESHLLPDLRAAAGDQSIHCRILRVSGLGESLVEERLKTVLHDCKTHGLEVAFRSDIGDVEVRFSAGGPDGEQRVASAEAAARRSLGKFIYGRNNENLESVIITEFTRRGLTLAVAESCTGGLVAHRLTNVPGASKVLIAGIVSYSNESKNTFLNVPRSVIAAQGAVSEATAKAMVEGLLEQTGADVGVSITGIAGPDGGSREKPVGTVYIGFRRSGGITDVIRQFNPFDRATFKQITSQQALDGLRRRLSAAE